MFDCCKDFAKGDEYLEFDCKSTLAGDEDCADQEQCYNSYLEKRAQVEIQNKAEAEEILKKEEEARNYVDEDDGALGWIGAILIIIATIVLCGGCCFVIFKTSCFHKPLFKSRTNIQNDTAQPDQEESDEVEDYEVTPKAVSKQSGMI